MLQSIRKVKTAGVMKYSAAMIIFVLTITLLLPAAVCCAKSAPDIDMQVKAGYEGIARLGAYVPYNVVLVNKGRAIEGEVLIEIKINSVSKTVFAKPFTLPEGAIKEIVINAPVFTARCAVTVKVQEKGKTVSKMEYSFIKMIPPEMRMIGVLSSDNSAYGFLNGMMLPVQNGTAYDEKMKAMIASGAAISYSASLAAAQDGSSVAKTESVLIPLNKENMPDDLKVMNGFDILIISNFDTVSLSEGQLQVLEKWVENGGTLVIGTGVNWKKTYSPLPETLKKFSVRDVRSVPPPPGLDGLSDKSFSGNVNLEVTTGNIGFQYVKKDKPDEAKGNSGTNEDGKKSGDTVQTIYSGNVNEVIAGDGENPLAIKYVHQQGCMLLLTFDPGMEPVAGWDGKREFWENLLFHASGNTDRYQQRGQGYYYSSTNRTNNFEYLTQQVPEDKQPPFLFMFITIGVYVVIVGPVLYILLKKKDKRDLNWLAVPAVSLLCLFIIYTVGFRTRYKTAVFNAVSMINLDMQNQKADIETGIGIFNNKKGDLKISYSKDSNMEFDINETGNRQYYSYPDGKEPEGRIVSRLSLTEPVNYELYDVSMWEQKYLSARKSEAFKDQLINSVQIRDGKFKAVIKNSTEYEFMDAFMSVGSSFFSIGDILPQQEVAVEIDLDSKDVYKNLETYLDAKYGRTSYPRNVKPPEDFAEKRRKRDIVQNILTNNYYSIRGQAKIGLYALNNQDMGFDVEINDKKPQVYYSNGIFASMDINFEKGKELEIPYGIVVPELKQDINTQQTAVLEDTNGVRVMKKGNIDFTYTLIKDIRYTGLSLRFDTYVPFYIKYNMEEMQQRDKNFQGKILQNRYEYYIYNRTADKWEKIGEKYDVNRNPADYIDDRNQLKVRVKAVELAEAKSDRSYGYTETERLALPELQLKGVAQ